MKQDLLNNFIHAIEGLPLLEKFYALFPFLVLIILAPTIFIQTFSSSNCSREVDFQGTALPNEQKAFEFTYKGSLDCSLFVFSKLDPSAGSDIWVYQPNGDIKVLDYAGDKNISFLTISDPEIGKYHVSVHNKENKEASFVVKVVSTLKTSPSLASDLSSK